MARIFGWVLSAVLMVVVGVLVIKFIPPLNRFVFGTSTPTTSA